MADTQPKVAQKPYDPQEELTKTVIKSLGKFRSEQAVQAAQAGKTDGEIINTLMELSNTTFQKPTGDTAGLFGPMFGYKPGQAITKPEQLGLSNAAMMMKLPGEIQSQQNSALEAPLRQGKMEAELIQMPLQAKKLEQETNLDSKVEQGKKEAQAKGSFLTANDLFTKYESSVQPFIIQRDAYARIKEAGNNPSPAGDLAVIYGYMKLLDPGSTVREGEFATAQNSGSIPQRIQAMYNKVASGKRLSIEQRDDFLNRSRRIYSSAEAQYGKTRKQFTKMAIANQLDPNSILRDAGIEETPQQEQTSQQSLPSRNSAPKGAKGWDTEKNAWVY